LLTIEDKNRPVTLAHDGAWHSIGIKDTDGIIKKTIVPPPGTYMLQYQLLGSVPRSWSGSRLEVRVQRYPVDAEGRGTAWDYIELHGLVTAATWMATRQAKVVVMPDGNYSTGIGLDYRIRGSGTGVVLAQRVLKFVGPL